MATLESVNNQQEAIKVFNQVKADGSRLLKEGKIDSKTYYAKTREAGIQLGIFGENEYPGRLPKWVEPTLEILGGTAGAIGGAIMGAPTGPGGVIGGAGIGAGLGSGGASLAVDFLGDLLAPDMPSPSTRERLTDAALTGTIDAGLTVAAPVVGKSLSPLLRNALDKGKQASLKIKSIMPSQDGGATLANKALGITDEAVSKANVLGKEGIELSLGQASSSPFVQGAYNLSSRMPIVGSPGQSQLKTSFQQVEKALNRRISPSAKIKPLSDSERSQLIKEVGLQSFKDWRNSYKKVYDKADQLNKAKGNFFDTSSLSSTAMKVYPKSKFTDAPKDILNLLDEINLYKSDFIASSKKGIAQTPSKLLDFNDVRALDTKLTDLAKKYDPAKSQTPNNYAYRTANALLDTMKRELRNPNDEAGRLYIAGDRLFKNYMEVVENKVGKEFQGAFGKGSIRPGIGKPPTQRAEDLYKRTFGDNKSPEAVKELRELIGKQELNKIAGNYLDDVFSKYIKGEKKDFNGLFRELGFDNPKSLKYEATEELLKDYTFTSAKDLEKLLSALKQFPEVLPDVNTFIMRAGALRAASNLGPSAIVGATGATAGIPAVGLLYAFNRFLSQPFNKDLVNKAIKSNPNGVKELLRRFTEYLPQISNSVPPSAIAVQPLVPIVEEQLNQ
tara:strand:- start:480 stop:2495 length:2016 start_codon:yes stop_codon:yes gene_type:complete